MSYSVLIVEPHGDDTLISCHSILQSPKAKVDILTLSERPSDGLKEFPDELPNLGTIRFVELEDYSWKKKPINHHQVNRWRKEGKNTHIEYLSILNEDPDFKRKISEIIKILSEFVLDYQDEYDLIFIPMGVIHPYHVAVKEAALTFGVLHDKYVFYSEPPYNGKKYGQILEEDQHKLESVMGYVPVVHLNIFPDKERIFSKVYPTETGMFRFSRKDILENTERYYTKVCNVDILRDILKGGS